MMKFALRFARDEDGGPLVEFTIMAPMFFLIMFGIFEFGMILYVKNAMVNAARDAARGGAVGTVTGAQAQALACTDLARTGQTYQISYTDNCTGSLTPAEPWITVQITAPTAHASIFNYRGLLTGNLSASVTIRKELACQAAAVNPSTYGC